MEQQARVCTVSAAQVQLNLGDIHRGGAPCTDFLTVGKRRALAGPTTAVFPTWALLLVAHTPLVVAHENVIGFPYELLRDLLEPHLGPATSRLAGSA